MEKVRYFTDIKWFMINKGILVIIILVGVHMSVVVALDHFQQIMYKLFSHHINFPSHVSSVCVPTKYSSDMMIWQKIPVIYMKFEDG